MTKKKNPTRYWWLVTWVNHKITPCDGYAKYHIGQVYGTRNQRQEHLRATDGEFYREEHYHSRILIPNIFLGEDWKETVNKIESFRKYIFGEKK